MVAHNKNMGDRMDVREAADKARDVMASGRSSAMHAKNQVVDAMQNAADTGRYALDQVERRIEDQPMLWTLSALGLGFALGALLMSRRRW